MKLTLKTFVIMFLIICSGQVQALKCGHRLIEEGDGKVKVMLRCGEPDFSETRDRRIPRHCVEDRYRDDYNSRYRINHQRCQYETVDVWTYNFGTTKFMRELVFVDGILEDINVLGYGY